MSGFMCKCTKYTLSLFSNSQESNTFRHAIGCTSNAYDSVIIILLWLLHRAKIQLFLLHDAFIRKKFVYLPSDYSNT